MATFEKRRNSAGEITAIRVKIRRVGMPHLSQSFPVANGSQTALRQAEKAAKAWVDEVTKGFGIQHGNIKAQFNRLGMGGVHALLEKNQHLTPITLPFVRVISKSQGDHLIINADSPQSRIIIALVLDCGLSLDEVSRLRWQHVQLNQKLVDVVGLSGLIQRQVPLTELAIEMLLTYNQRKYGLIFSDSELQHFNELPDALVNAFNQVKSTSLEQAIKREAAYRMADKGLDENSICTYLGISDLQTLNNHSYFNNKQGFEQMY
ncbi:MAG: hypothetical protein SFU55_08625 [Methylophilus sp.]|nr:hypothetical protein [Methylophilus sp.]